MNKECIQNKWHLVKDKISHGSKNVGIAINNTASKAGGFLAEKKYLYPSFLLPIGILLCVYAIMGMFPFGKNTILTLDMNAQYIYFFEQYKDIFQGNGSFLYTFERALGGEFFGFYTYYLASPFTLIILLFPSGMITEAVMTMMLVKCGAAGLTFSVFLDKTQKRNPFAFTAFSTMYALCAYSTAYQSNTMWMDALIWLPLITLGLQKLITDGRFKLYIVSLALAIWSNYYIGYMLCIYIVLYFFCYIFTHKNETINNLGEKYHRLKSLLRVFVSSVVAVLCVSVIVLTAYYSLTFGKNDFRQSDFAPDLRFDLLDLLTKCFIGSYDNVRPSGLPNIYCGTLTLILIPVFFASKKISFREKLFFSILSTLFVVSFSINTIDLVWHGFQMPVWLNYRYSFILSFLMLIMAYKGFESYFEVEFRFIGCVGAVLAVILFVIQKTVTLKRYIDGSEKEVMPDYEIIWLSLLFIFAYIIILYVYKHSKLVLTASVVLCIIVGVEAFAGSLINWGEEVSDVGWASRKNYRNFVDTLKPSVNYIYDNDSSFYRFEKTATRKPNDNFALDIRGISNSTSSLNKNAITFLGKLGFASKSHWSKYYSGNEAVDSLLGIKYVISKSMSNDDGVPVSSLYTPVNDDGNYTVYMNPYALSVAFCADKSIVDFQLDNSKVYSAFDYTERLYASLSGQSNVHLFDSCTYKVSDKTNCNNSLDTNQFLEFTRKSESSKASFVFNVSPKHDGSVYFYMPSMYSTKATIYVNGEKLCTYFDSETYRVYNIGNYSVDDNIKVKVEFDAWRLYLYNDTSFFVQINEENLRKLTDDFKKGELKIDSFSDTRFDGTISSSGDKVVYTTLPYDSGWNVYIDGKKVETYKAMDCMLAFDISEGEHTVSMRYCPTVFEAGVVLSVVGVAIFITMCILAKKMKIKEQNCDDLPCERNS